MCPVSSPPLRPPREGPQQPAVHSQGKLFGYQVIFSRRTVASQRFVQDEAKEVVQGLLDKSVAAQDGLPAGARAGTRAGTRSGASS